jgi:hypothetical protein
VDVGSETLAFDTEREVNAAVLIAEWKWLP